LPATSTFLQPWLEPVLGRWLYVDSGLWTVVGFLGAAIFGSRFVLQWLKSEKEKKLVVPWYFWHLSFWGSVLNLLYFLHLDKAPLILGNCFLPFLYGRNILFLRAGGEKGRGRLVFAAVAVLVLLGFGISAFTGAAEGTDDVARATDGMGNVSKALVNYQKTHKTLPSGDTRSIVKALVDGGTLTAGKDITKEGEWLDPWGQPYRIFISGNSALFRCAGPNGVFDDGDNDKRDDLLMETRFE
jgi:lipid-A-disaccharide synthase-like uncharacterized protein